MASVGFGCNGDRGSEEICCNCSSEKLKMDDSISDHRRSVSENTNGSSWSHCWDTEDGSVSRLNMESSEELQNLMEDREIASRAVAFVVNSTRKGFVPLCANVASLMRSKRRLEKKVARLKHEVEVLHSLNPNGSSKRPTPTSLDSLSSDKDVFMDPAHIHIFNELLKENYRCSSTSCSRSSSSSQVSNSPKPTKKNAQDFPKTSTGVTPDGIPHVVTVLVHRSSDSLPKMEANETSEDLVDSNVVKCHKKLTSKAIDQNSGHLPETEYQSVSGCRARNQMGLQIPDSGKLRGVGPHCRSESSRVNGHCEDEGGDVNMLLANELAASRLEIERLRSKLKQYEVRDCTSTKGILHATDDVFLKRSSACLCQASSSSQSAVAASAESATHVGTKERNSRKFSDSSHAEESCACTVKLPKHQKPSQIHKDDRTSDTLSLPTVLSDCGVTIGQHGSSVRRVCTQGAGDESCVRLELETPDVCRVSNGTCTDNPRLVVQTLEAQSVSSEAKPDDCHSDDRRKSSKSPPLSRSQARPLHRSKALHKQNGQLKYSQVAQVTNLGDRYLV